jgi:DNA-binding transcriptional LysR family regulator
MKRTMPRHSSISRDPADYLFRRLRLRHLQLLTLLDETGSVRGAAQGLSLSQPAVSKMLSEVESAFGLRLFDRGRRGVQANAHGRAAIYRARVALNELKGAAQDMQSMQGGGALLRLGTLSITEIVPAAVLQLLARLPGSHVLIREGQAHELVAQLLDAELDCVFGALGPASLESQSVAELNVDVISEDHLCVLFNTAHPLTTKRRIQWRDLQGQRWVAPPRSTVLRQAFIAAFSNLGLAAPVPTVEVTSPVTTRALIAADASLIGVVRHGGGRQQDALPNMTLRDVGPKARLPPLCALTRRTGLEAPDGVRLFIDSLKCAAR